MTERKVIVKRYVFLSISVFIAALIFWFSDQTAEISSNNSEGLIWNVMNMIPYYARMANDAKLEIVDSIHTIVRKSAHFSVYALLGICVFNYIVTYFSVKKKAFIVSIVICVSYAISDEIHQLFVDGRSGEVTDVFIDTCGAITGVCLLLAVSAIISGLRRCKDE